MDVEDFGCADVAFRITPSSSNEGQFEFDLQKKGVDKSDRELAGVYNICFDVSFEILFDILHSLDNLHYISM